MTSVLTPAGPNTGTIAFQPGEYELDVEPYLKRVALLFMLVLTIFGLFIILARTATIALV